MLSIGHASTLLYSMLRLTGVKAVNPKYEVVGKPSVTLDDINKERELSDVEHRHPADHYVMIDDKLRILTAIKRIWGVRVATVLIRQGHYAHDPQVLASFPPADVSIEIIGDLLNYDLDTLLAKQRVA